MEPTQPRPAATVVVARPGEPDGVEVLMLRRGPGVTFGPGFIVFPGGTIDPEDADVAATWFGDAEEAPRAAAVRELAEETRLLVSQDGVRLLDSREDVIDAISADPPRAEGLPELARWIAPEFLEVRFDARFFAVAAPRGIDGVADGIENDLAWWARPADVLKEYDLGSTLMWPTYNTLKGLAECSTVDDVLSLRMEQVAPPMPRPS